MNMSGRSRRLAGLDDWTGWSTGQLEWNGPGIDGQDIIDSTFNFLTKTSLNWHQIQTYFQHLYRKHRKGKWIFIAGDCGESFGEAVMQLFFFIGRPGPSDRPATNVVDDARNACLSLLGFFLRDVTTTKSSVYASCEARNKERDSHIDFVSTFLYLYK